MSSVDREAFVRALTEFQWAVRASCEAYASHSLSARDETEKAEREQRYAVERLYDTKPSAPPAAGDKKAVGDTTPQPGPVGREQFKGMAIEVWAEMADREKARAEEAESMCRALEIEVGAYESKVHALESRLAEGEGVSDKLVPNDARDTTEITVRCPYPWCPGTMTVSGGDLDFLLQSLTAFRKDHINCKPTYHYTTKVKP